MKNTSGSSERQCIVLDPQDNVATAIRDLKAGEIVETEIGKITLSQAIVGGHKFALLNIQRGDYIIKYGAQIGRATVGISKGEHVHVHNVEDIVDEVRRK